MSNQLPFHSILSQFRKYAFSERDKGDKFERLMQAYLQTDPRYADLFSNVWLWNDFFAKKDFGGKDTGIDLVARTHSGDFWAIQCKCYQENTVIDKPAVDAFLSTSSRQFKNEQHQTVGFEHRLWISTTNKWGPNAEEAIKNQHPAVNRIGLHDLENAPVDWEKLAAGLTGEASRAPKKTPMPHQIEAIEKANEYFKTAARGKLIMACGTGKTFTSLKIVEKETNGKGLALFLVPSIALLGQTLREWSADAEQPFNAVCICSDAGVSKKRSKNEDSDGFTVVDLALPASTDVKSILKQFDQIQAAQSRPLTVVFSTYQSIEVIAAAQKALLEKQVGSENPFGIFDLIVCDEAHRTTGVTLANDDESAFVKVHDNNFLQAKKRLYMTATPRLFSDDSKSKAAQAEAVLCSMDDAAIYGEEIYRIGFGEAVNKGLLADYKVLILTVSEADMAGPVQKMVADANHEINADDASKLIGCINALSKKMLGDNGILKDTDPEPMRRAVAFCQNIKISEKTTRTFNETKHAYFNGLSPEAREELVSIHAQHIDGGMATPTRDEKLAWLKADPDDPRECRILSNVRCLSEGVDVPSLDAVLFLSARNSQVDVVQSVGRVMRRAPGKKYGYIIIPVVVPANVSPEVALNDNERFKVVWTVLNALRAHDDRFNATVNKIELNKQRPDQILVGRPDYRPADDTEFAKKGEFDASTAEANTAYQRAGENINRQLALQFEQLQSVLFARMVQKVGDRRYWEQWAKDVAEIAERHIERIARLTREEGEHQRAFASFLAGLQKNINPAISEAEAIEMLAQHIITKPVFEALFEGYSFVKNNAISVSMQAMLDLLEAQSLEKDTEILQKFYDSVRARAAGIDNAAGRQRIIVELYDKFFKTAFPKMVEKLGIVYTPVEVVDFILRSVEDLLQKEFGRSISDENVHILDPFTGTGTFITRLLQSGLIQKKDLARKYAHELHANEIVLLAYYIAAINIENAYHDAVGDKGMGIGEWAGHTHSSLLNQTNNGENEFIQRSDRLAGSHELGNDGLSSNSAIPKGRTLRTDQPDTQSSRLDSDEHSRGQRSQVETGLPSFSDDSARLTDGIRNTSSDSGADRIDNSQHHTAHFRANPNSGSSAKRASEVSLSIGTEEQGTENRDLGTAQSPVPSPYSPFEGIVLTDTFQLGETDDSEKLFSDMFPQNSARVQAQKRAPLRVILGNPPYSVGQKSANDNAQNQEYPRLNARIAATYAKETDATNKNSLYDSYIKAFRWSSDRLDKEHGGIIAFVSNGAWLDGNSADGFRKCLQREFSAIYVFNLRGNQRTSGELSRKEGGKIFGSGSRTPIAITFLVKKGELGTGTGELETASSPNSQVPSPKIFYYDIGDYLSREDKLNIIKKFGSVSNLPFLEIQPNEHGDWISMRDDAFGNFIGMGDKEDKTAKTFFNPVYSRGLASARDAWCYNSKRADLEKNMGSLVDFYNEQRSAFHEKRRAKPDLDVEAFVSFDSTKITWNRGLKQDLEKNKVISFDKKCVFTAMYRPFFKQHLYFARELNDMVYQMPKLFPTPNTQNRVICVSGVGVTKEFSCIISDIIPDLELIGKSQCFPLYYYEERQKSSPSLFDASGETEHLRRDGVSDWILTQAKTRYGGTVTKEDVFYYVYGFLHSPQYRERFSADLKKMLPRLPLVESPKDFWAFSKAGRKLADLHLGYDDFTKAPSAEAIGVRVVGLGTGELGLGNGDWGLGTGERGFESPMPNPQSLFRVEKMRFPSKTDKATILFNSHIRVENIPAAAYEYVVNGKSAIEWVMERYAVTVHKESGIRNDPNDWAAEVGNPRYILDLLLSVIRLSVETVEVVRGLPGVNF